jgi:putative CocE/NonD family hydrolase
MERYCERRAGAYNGSMSKKLNALIVFVLVLVLTHGIAAQTPDASGSSNYDIAAFPNIMVPMRDDVRLATNIYRPAENGRVVEGKFPVILERTPYGKDNDVYYANHWVKQGYVVILQDVRGRFNSGGTWRFFRDDIHDGYDTAQWISSQPWSNCSIGTVGGSYPGGTQHALALSNPPCLKAMIPAYATADTGRVGLRNSGAFELRWMNWIFNLFEPEGDPDGAKNTQAMAKLGEQVREYVKGLPLRPGTTPLRLVPSYEHWLTEAMSHGDNDTYWKDIGVDVVDHVAEYKDIPVYHLTGWFDSNLGGTSLNWIALSKTKHNQKLIIGPGWHGGASHTNAGEAEFGPSARIDPDHLTSHWFDHWLKGIDNGVDREAPVRLFIMGDGDGHKTSDGRIFVGGRWRDESEWPPKRAIQTSYYLHSNGVLSPEKPSNEPPTSYEFDPQHPVPTIGGNIAAHYGPHHNTIERPGDSGNLLEQGPYDQRCRAELWNCDDTRPLSARNDVLVFETEPLKEDVEVTGPLSVKLWASSTAPDTDFTAKLLNVYPPSNDFPGGFDLGVQDGIIRARYRNSLEYAELMKPGDVYQISIDVYPTAMIFKKGHRIRLDISSSNFPRFDVNPNTGEPLNDNRRSVIAVNTIYHDDRHPSQIVLPIVPAV